MKKSTKSRSKSKLIGPQTKHTSIELQKAEDDEEIFPLKAKDWSAPTTVIFWIALNFITAPEEKLRRAFESALRMRKAANRKVAD